VLFGLPFTDESKAGEIRELLCEIIALITTHDEAKDLENVERFAKMISI
jgi:hypothetical protein